MSLIAVSPYANLTPVPGGIPRGPALYDPAPYDSAPPSRVLRGFGHLRYAHSRRAGTGSYMIRSGSVRFGAKVVNPGGR